MARVKRCKKKKQLKKYSFPSLLLGRHLLAVVFTSATSLFSPYIHFGSSVGPPPHSSAPVRGFPAACKLHAHIWTEDVTESPSPSPPSSPPVDAGEMESDVATSGDLFLACKSLLIVLFFLFLN